jgi:hypothetical protein
LIASNFQFEELLNWFYRHRDSVILVRFSYRIDGFWIQGYEFLAKLYQAALPSLYPLPFTAAAFAYHPYENP